MNNMGKMTIHSYFTIIHNTMNKDFVKAFAHHESITNHRCQRWFTSIFHYSLLKLINSSLLIIFLQLRSILSKKWFLHTNVQHIFFPYPLVMTNSLLLKMTIEIMRFPSYKIVHLSIFVNVDQRVDINYPPFIAISICGWHIYIYILFK